MCKGGTEKQVSNKEGNKANKREMHARKQKGIY